MTEVDWGCNEEFWCLPNHSMCVPLGMQPWWLEGNPRGEPDVIGHVEPEMTRVLAREYDYRVYEGASSMRIFTRNHTHEAGVYIRMPAVAGQVYSFRVQAHIWTAADIEDDPPVSEGDPYGFGLRIGIDPSGGVDPLSNNIVWGDWRGKDAWDHYEELAVSAVAQAVHITFFTKSFCKWRSRYNESYWDRFVVEGALPPPDPPQGRVVTHAEMANTLTVLRDALDDVVDVLDGEVERYTHE